MMFLVVLLIIFVEFSWEIEYEWDIHPGETKFNVANNPYELMNTITVEDGAVLIIEEGVQIIMCEGCSLIVKGSIEMIGSENNPIMFTTNETTRTKGFWGSVDLHSGDHKIQNVIFEYGGKHVEGSDTAIVIIRKKDGDSKLSLTDCEFSNSGTSGLLTYRDTEIVLGQFGRNTEHGIRAVGHPKLIVSKSMIENNGLDGIHYPYNDSVAAELTVDQTRIHENKHNGILIQSYSFLSSCTCLLLVTLNDCTVTYNEQNGLAVLVGEESETDLLIHTRINQSRFLQNTHWGARLDATISFTLEYNTFENNMNAFGRGDKVLTNKVINMYHNSSDDATARPFMTTKVMNNVVKENSIFQNDETSDIHDVVSMNYLFSTEVIFNNNHIEKNYGVIKFKKLQYGLSTSPTSIEISNNVIIDNHVGVQEKRSLLQIYNYIDNLEYTKHYDIVMKNNQITNNIGSFDAAVLQVAYCCTTSNGDGGQVMKLHQNQLVNPMFGYEIVTEIDDAVRSPIQGENNWWGYIHENQIAKRVDLEDTGCQNVTNSPFLDAGTDLDCSMCSYPRQNCKLPQDDESILLCECPEGYFPPNMCIDYACNSISFSSSDVCSGHGVCESPDNCTCAAGGYTGKYCDEWTCDLRNDCNGHGKCVALDTCFCVENYFGEECNVIRCGKGYSNDTDLCSGHGACEIGKVSCSCATKYFGSDCEVTTCYGKMNNETVGDDSICGGHGTCLDHDDCKCEEGYGGDECTEIECYGISSDDHVKVCSGHGTCLAPNKCWCKEGYFSEYCYVTTCDGKWNNDTIHSVCSNHGNCRDKDVCICSDYFFGDSCDIIECNGIYSNETVREICSAHGECKEKPANEERGTFCDCTDGYFRDNCDVTKCNGVYSDLETVCSKHGRCVDSICECQKNYTGVDCNSYDCFGVQHELREEVCSGHGTCDEADHCQCDENFSGGDCSVNIDKKPDDKHDGDGQGSDKNDEEKEGEGGVLDLTTLVIIVVGSVSCIVLLVIVLLLICLLTAIIIVKKRKKKKDDDTFRGFKKTSGKGGMGNFNQLEDDEEITFDEFELPAIEHPSGGSDDEVNNNNAGKKLDNDNAYLGNSTKKESGGGMLKRAGESSDDFDFDDRNFTFN